MSDPLLQPIDDDEEVRGVDATIEDEILDFQERLTLEEDEEEELPDAPNVDADDTEHYTLSGTKPYFDLVLKNTNVGQYSKVYIPTKITSELPSSKAPVVLTSHGKRWRTTTPKLFQGKKNFGWRKFVVDNGLKVGDCCFFELIEANNTRVVFKVIILRGFPASQSGETSEGADGDGDTEEKPIIIK
ncbi:OLC1v1030872C1 [Oldenlandia corymbosa var. corymbosa]|uniref:OLC1v1030872C1 n=1 Tax=Oldenlandia corymbosa var. corymbosa TaxID=529605 RepID=A0AAV1CHR0_OLDCO|nr:OLC1v1030872C1 [Oldenlandia corymbosa var. corymbosa]